MHDAIELCWSYFLALNGASIVSYMYVSRVAATQRGLTDQSDFYRFKLLQGLDILQTILIFAVMAAMAFAGLQVSVRAPCKQLISVWICFFNEEGTTR